MARKEKQIKETIASVAIECIKRDNIGSFIDMGKFGLLDEIYRECVDRGVITDSKFHPLDRQVYIMRQLRKSNAFKMVGYIEYKGMGRAYAKCTVLEPVNKLRSK